MAPSVRISPRLQRQACAFEGGGSCGSGGGAGQQQRSRSSSGQSSGSNGKLHGETQVIRPCPVKKGPAPTPLAAAGNVPGAVVVAPVPVQITTADRQQIAQNHQSRQQIAAQKVAEHEAARRRLQQQQIALHQAQQQQVQQRKALLQKRKEEEAAAEAAARQQEDRRHREARARQESQCAFPVSQQPPRANRMLHSQQQQADGAMGSSEHANGDRAGQIQQHRRQQQHQGGYRQQPTHSGQPPQRLHGRSTSSAMSSTDMSTGKQHFAVDGNDGGPSSASDHPPPLFERLVSEEVQELKAYARIIESQNRRLADLERIHDDLEARLELQTKERMDLEARLDEREKSWAAKCEALEKERDEWKGFVQTERTKNERLLDQVHRKDKDIHRMLQRKYDHRDQHGHPHSHSLRDLHIKRTNSSDRGAISQPQHPPSSKTHPSSVNGNHYEKRHTALQHKSPHEILATGGSVEAVRERNVTNSLLDFFGM